MTPSPFHAFAPVPNSLTSTNTTSLSLPLLRYPEKQSRYQLLDFDHRGAVCLSYPYAAVARWQALRDCPCPSDAALEESLTRSIFGQRCLGKRPPLIACNAVLLRDPVDLKVNSSINQRKMGGFSLMTNKPQPQSLPISKNLQRTFEAAVRDVYQVSLTGKTSWARTPIVQRAAAGTAESYVAAEKRALSDAAKALAQLWRVSPSR